MVRRALQVFASVTPGLEQFLQRDIAQLLRPAGSQWATVHPGGIEFASDVPNIWTLCNYCRVAETLRVRLGKFKAETFAQFSRGIHNLNWAPFVGSGSYIHIKASASKSALYHTEAIADRAKDVLSKKLGTGTAPAAAIYIRVEQDEVEVSVDASGEQLYKRGYNKHIVDAPLRETIAAACLRAADFGTNDVLWDPFMGCGTIPIEASGMRSMRVLPVHRRFAFQLWPSYKADKYEAFLAEQHAKIEEELKRTKTGTLRQLMGSDIDKKAILAAEHNCRALGISAEMLFGSNDFEVLCPSVPQHAVIVTNLPYGKRLSPVALRRTMSRFGDMLRRRTDFERVVVLNALPWFEQVTGLKWDKVAEFRNGGIPISMLKLHR